PPLGRPLPGQPAPDVVKPSKRMRLSVAEECADPEEGDDEASDSSDEVEVDSEEVAAPDMPVMDEEAADSEGSEHMIEAVKDATENVLRISVEAQKVQAELQRHLDDLHQRLAEEEVEEP